MTRVLPLHLRVPYNTGTHEIGIREVWEMRAKWVILVVLSILFLSGGCRTKSGGTPTAEVHDNKKESRSAHLSVLDERLCQAVADGDIDQVRTLIADGANVNARDEFGGTALYYALLDSPTEVVGLLLAHARGPRSPGRLWHNCVA